MVLAAALVARGLCCSRSHDHEDRRPPAPDREPELPPWNPDGTEDVAAFAWGVQVGDVDAATAIVGVRTTDAEGLALVLALAGRQAWTEVGRVENLVPDGGVVHVTLTDLLADSAYSLAFYAADGARRSGVARFRTAQAPGAGARKIVFGATSCFGAADFPFPSLQSAAGERLDFFVLLGDTVYADGAETFEEFQAYYLANFEAAPLQEMFSSTSVVATWDDHEIGNNWSWNVMTQETFDAALAAFREAVPQRSGPRGTRIWRKIAWGPSVDLFVLDCRGERKDDRTISVEQMAWLKAALSASTARFKLILSSTPITDMTGWIGTAGASDRWQGYAQRGEILEHIRAGGITGVLWISGDQHLGMVNRVDSPGGAAEDAWEVLAGPVGSAINPLGEQVPVGDQYELVVLDWNWVRFELDPSLGTAQLAFIGDDGGVRGEMELRL